ncbi:MAG TPA: hypothetical protein VII87_07015 [Solirubrobacteraceae bacterium]
MTRELGRLIAAHRAASAGVIAALLLVIAAMAAPAFSNSKGGALDDATTCSEWASASPAQRLTYSRLYLTEHDALLLGPRNAHGVESAINNACIHAAYLGEGDEVSMVAAIKHEY